MFPSTGAAAPNQPALRLHRPDLSLRELDVLAAVRDFAAWPLWMTAARIAGAVALQDCRKYRSRPARAKPDAGAARSTLAALASYGLVAGAADFAAYDRGPVYVTPAGLAWLPPGPPPVLADLLADGWLPGLPGSVLMSDVWTDKEMCWTMVCGGCRRAGLSYRPMRRLIKSPGGDTRPRALPVKYTAYSVCLKCGFAEGV